MAVPDIEHKSYQAAKQYNYDTLHSSQQRRAPGPHERKMSGHGSRPRTYKPTSPCKDGKREQQQQRQHKSLVL
jgi:hypothetical protein